MENEPVSPANMPGSAPQVTPAPPRHSPFFIVGMGALFLALVSAAYWLYVGAPGTVEMPKKIGIAYFPQGAGSVAGLKQGMEKLGYREGENVLYIEREIIPGPTMVDDMRTAFRKMIEEDNVDLIWEDHEHQAKVALEFTKEIGRTDVPIVYLMRFHDPISYGMADSFMSSGNNATGVIGNIEEVTGRIVQFAKEINPGAKKLGIFGKGFMIPDVAPGYVEELKRQTARAGMQFVEYTTNVPPPEAEKAFGAVSAKIRKGDIDALIHIPGHFYVLQQVGEYELAKRLGIPQAVPYEDLPGGGHFSYASNYEFSGEQSAALVDKIFKGVRPSDIPLEYGARTDLVLDLKRAAESGIQFSDSMLFIAVEKIGDATEAPPTSR